MEKTLSLMSRRHSEPSMKMKDRSALLAVQINDENFSSFRKMLNIYKSETKKICEAFNERSVKSLEETVERLRAQAESRSALVKHLEVELENMVDVVSDFLEKYNSIDQGDEK